MLPSIRENRLFLGNPGTGKSTLINCLVGEQALASGISWGGGLTQEYQRVEHDGVAYMDTPGLADQTIIKHAAEAITTALKQSGSYKLFFMVRLMNGRVVSEDIATIERVLDSIDIHGQKPPYAVVLNNIGVKQYETLKSRGPEFDQVSAVINSQKYPASAFCLIPTISALTEASEIVELPAHVIKFVESEAPVIRIESSNVKSINLKNFELQTLKIRDEIAELQRSHQRLLDQMREQQLRHEEEMRQERARHLYAPDPVVIDVADLHGYPGNDDRNGVAYAVPTGNYASHPSTPKGASSSTRRDDCLLMCCCVVLFGPLGICFYYCVQADD